MKFTPLYGIGVFLAIIGIAVAGEPQTTSVPPAPCAGTVQIVGQDIGTTTTEDVIQVPVTVRTTVSRVLEPTTVSLPPIACTPCQEPQPVVVSTAPPVSVPCVPCTVTAPPVPVTVATPDCGGGGSTDTGRSGPIARFRERRADGGLLSRLCGRRNGI